MKFVLTRKGILKMKSSRELDSIIHMLIFKNPFFSTFYADESSPTGYSVAPTVPMYSTVDGDAFRIIRSFDRREWDIDIHSDTEDEGKIWSVSFMQYPNETEPEGLKAEGSCNDREFCVAVCKAAMLAIIKV